MRLINILEEFSSDEPTVKSAFPESKFRKRKITFLSVPQALAQAKRVFEDILLGKTSPDELVQHLLIIPPEAAGALHKLARGEIKQFTETFIENYSCAYVDNECREHGPRVSYAAAYRRSYLELYSECMRLDLALHAVLGDLSYFLAYEHGYRDTRKYIRIAIPYVLLNEQFIDLLASNVHTPMIPLHVDTLEDAVNAVLSNRDRITEVIVTIPCLTEEFYHYVVDPLMKLLDDNIKLYIVVRWLSSASLVCRQMSKKYLAMYLELLSEMMDRGVEVCLYDVDIPQIIVNRDSVIVIPFENTRISTTTRVLSILDSAYAQTHTTSLLRACICSNPLTREDER